MSLVSDLTDFFSTSVATPSAQLQQVSKANILVNDVMLPWILKSSCGLSMLHPLSINPGGISLVIAGMMGVPSPIPPPANPNSMLVGQGIAMLFLGMPFASGVPFLPPPVVANMGPNLSIAPVVPFLLPPTPGMPPLVIAQTWAGLLMATAASVMVSGIDVTPSPAGPVPTPFVLPLIPASIV